VGTTSDAAKAVRPVFVGSVIEAGALLAAWIFVAGWAYVYAYYEQFAININSLNIPAHHFPVFVFAFMASLEWEGIILALLFIGIGMILFWGTQIEKKSWALVFGFTLIVVFIFSFILAARGGRKLARLNSGADSSLPRIVVQLKDGVPIRHADVDQALKSSNLRLLVEQDDRLFVFEPLSAGQGRVTLKVYEFKRGEVIYSILSHSHR